MLVIIPNINIKIPVTNTHGNIIHRELQISMQWLAVITALYSIVSMLDRGYALLQEQRYCLVGLPPVSVSMALRVVGRSQHGVASTICHSLLPHSLLLRLQRPLGIPPCTWESGIWESFSQSITKNQIMPTKSGLHLTPGFMDLTNGIPRKQVHHHLPQIVAVDKSGGNLHPVV